MVDCGVFVFFCLTEFKYYLSEVNRLSAFERCSLNINEVKFLLLFTSLIAVD